jgi:hypothetical protein
MTTENAATTDTAAVAEQGATVAPEKASSKKAASPRKGVPKRQKIAKGGKPKAPGTAYENRRGSTQTEHPLKMGRNWPVMPNITLMLVPLKVSPDIIPAP